MTTNNEEHPYLYDGVPYKVEPQKPFPVKEEAVLLTRADLIKRIVPWLNDLADHPDDISRTYTAESIIDLTFKALFALGARHTYGYNQVLIFSWQGLKEAGFLVPSYYPTCQNCGRNGADVLSYYSHVGGRGDTVLATHCIDLDACDARQMLKIMKGKDNNA